MKLSNRAFDLMCISGYWSYALQNRKEGNAEGLNRCLGLIEKQLDHAYTHNFYSYEQSRSSREDTRRIARLINYISKHCDKYEDGSTLLGYIIAYCNAHKYMSKTLRKRYISYIKGE